MSKQWASKCGKPSNVAQRVSFQNLPPQPSQKPSQWLGGYGGYGECEQVPLCLMTTELCSNDWRGHSWNAPFPKVGWFFFISLFHIVFVLYVCYVCCISWTVQINGGGGHRLVYSTLMAQMDHLLFLANHCTDLNAFWPCSLIQLFWSFKK